MPSARELLEQADALMRRNRARDTMSPAMGPRTMAPMTTTRKAAPGDFPVLTESMQSPPAAPAHTPSPSSPSLDSRLHGNDGPTEPTLRAPPETAAHGSAQSTARALNDPQPHVLDDPSPRAPAERVSRPAYEAARIVPPVVNAPARVESASLPQPAQSWQSPAVADVPPLVAIDASRPAARAFADVPVLTDAIEEIDAALIAAADEGVPSIWNDEAMQGDDSVLGPAPKSIAVIADSREIDRARAHDTQGAAAAAAEAAAASSAAASSAVAASTAELIDEVRMQVLQRIDMFTDTGLREQLGERLKPIVDRASAELVATINQHVGELLRTYVAEAIERELDRLRNEVR